MMTTVTVAREKWCPFARAQWSRGSSPSMAEVTNQTRCITSDCMAWRWSATLKEFGHCGLAGTPVDRNVGARAPPVSVPPESQSCPR
jgi:hypothetical protein